MHIQVFILDTNEILGNILYQMKKNHFETGNIGENLAVEFLQKNGFNILERNWRSKHLEIDIIASKNHQLIFVEVKTRRSLAFGYPEESINKIKMKRLRLAASVYQFKHPQFRSIQFNVIAIVMLPDQPIALTMFEDVYF
jgi:putative endonuclease